MEQTKLLTSVPATIMRGGTSKGVFIKRCDFPEWDDRARRDQIILALMGTPDPMQIDGLGGTHSSTSKLVVVAAASQPDLDLEYTFVQVGIDAPVVDYMGNCGNLTAAVAPFGLFEELVAGVEPVTKIALWNTNTQKRIIAEVPFGRSVVEQGDFQIDGVPHPGAPIVIHFLEPGGTSTGKLLPTGRTQDVVPTSRGKFEVSIVDVTNPVVFVRASALGLEGIELPSSLNADRTLLEGLAEIRCRAAVLAGIHADEEQAGRSNVPSIAVVGPPQDYVTATGRTIRAADLDLVARIVSMGRVHHAYQGTGAMCTTAATQLQGTIPYQVAGGGSQKQVVLGHPKGLFTAEVEVEAIESGGQNLTKISVTRTARRLMRGMAYAHC
jgi:2-methylaconitate cis-trans-isomerase PrpF